MRSPVRLVTLARLLIVWGLVGCTSQEQISPSGQPGTTAATAMSAPSTLTALPAAEIVALQMPTATHRPVTTTLPTLIPPPSVIPSPSTTSTPDLPSLHTPTPDLPPLHTPMAGESVALSLGWRLDANGHLTVAQSATLGGQMTILVASLGRTVYALNRDGTVRWQARTQGPVYALAVLDQERVAVGDDAGQVTILDARGRVLARYPLESRVTALHAWQGGLLAGGWDERLTFLDLQAGADPVRWQVSLSGPVSAISNLDDVATAATLDGQLWAFDLQGDPAWRRELGAEVSNLGAWQQAPQGFLAALQDGCLVALDRRGKELWRQSLGQEAEGSPIWHVIQPTGDGPIAIAIAAAGAEPALALLSGDGQVGWRVPLPSSPGALAALDLEGDGQPEILAGLSSGEIQVYDTSGRLRGSVNAGLSVWGMTPLDQTSLLVRADVVAWKVEATAGPAGHAWLAPPPMLPVPPHDLSTMTGTRSATEDSVELVFLGDVSPGRSMEAQVARFGPDYLWQGLGNLLHEADLAVANLEGVLTTRGQPMDKSYLIRAHPRWGAVLAAGGFDVVTLANNHALDYGGPGLDQTLSTLEALGIQAVGAGPSRAAAHEPVILEARGVRVAILAYAAARWNGSKDVPATDRLAWAVEADVRAGVEAVRDQVDLVIVLLHAGTEYASEPSADQVAITRAAVDAGADLVVGHHPHVTQTVERYGQGLIVYSLGDALFDIPRPAAMQGHLLRVQATHQGLSQAELWPFWIDDAIRPRLLDDGQGQPLVEVIYP